MARLVKRARSEPYELTVGSETQSICGCGLSGTFPICDGTHKITKTEELGSLVWYDAAKKRHPASGEFDGILENDKVAAKA